MSLPTWQPVPTLWDPRPQRGLFLALTHLFGHDKTLQYSTDMASAIGCGCAGFPGVSNPHRTSIRGVPQTNGIADSRVKKVIRGTQTLLLQVGRPHVWWPYASRCFAAIRNFAADDDASPSGHRHGGIRSPAHSYRLVHAMPSALHKERNLKFEPRLKPVVFLGYVVQCGGKWCGEYLWAFIEDFADRCFYSRSWWSECSVAVHSERELKFESGRPIELPCASKY